MPDSRTPQPGRKPYDLTTAAHDYPEWRGPPRRSILICSHPRSGSTLLGEGLYFAGGLGCPLEYFHHGFRPDFERRWGVSDLDRFADAVWRHRTDPDGTLSVKLFWYDIEAIAREAQPDLAEFTHADPAQVPASYYAALAGLIDRLFPNPEIVHLWRNDRVRAAISGLTAVDTGLFRSIPGEADQLNGEPEFSCERIARMIGYSQHCEAHLRNLYTAMDAAPLELSYEELDRDYRGTMRRLLDRLGSDAEPQPPRMQRQSGAASEAMVLRYLRECGQRSEPVA